METRVRGSASIKAQSVFGSQNKVVFYEPTCTRGIVEQGLPSAPGEALPVASGDGAKIASAIAEK